MTTDDLVIHTDRLGKRYGAVTALEDLNLAIAPGEVYGFLGPNGAGKTTTIRLLLGLHRPTSGTATIFRQDAWSRSVQSHRRLAFVAGEPQLWPNRTGAECLEFLGRLHGGVDRAYRSQLAERFSFDPGRRVREYSKGNRQKIQLIAAFATRAELLILDEPTSGLDPLMEAAFRETVAEAVGQGQTVFLSSHILSEVEALCNRVGLLRDGRLIEQGTLDELRHLSQTVVEVTFAGAPPQLPDLPGVSVTSVGAARLRLLVQGPVGPVVDALAGHGVVSLSSREPSLEELFLAQYERSNPAGSHVGT